MVLMEMRVEDGFNSYILEEVVVGRKFYEKIKTVVNSIKHIHMTRMDGTSMVEEEVLCNVKISDFDAEQEVYGSFEQDINYLFCEMEDGVNELGLDFEKELFNIQRLINRA